MNLSWVCPEYPASLLENQRCRDVMAPLLQDPPGEDGGRVQVFRVPGLRKKPATSGTTPVSIAMTISNSICTYICIKPTCVYMMDKKNVFN